LQRINSNLVDRLENTADQVREKLKEANISKLTKFSVSNYSNYVDLIKVPSKPDSSQQRYNSVDQIVDSMLTDVKRSDASKRGLEVVETSIQNLTKQHYTNSKSNSGLNYNSNSSLNYQSNRNFSHLKVKEDINFSFR